MITEFANCFDIEMRAISTLKLKWKCICRREILISIQKISENNLTIEVFDNKSSEKNLCIEKSEKGGRNLSTPLLSASFPAFCRNYQKNPACSSS